jgi:transcriptional regulator with XRE-family HTH domain
MDINKRIESRRKALGLMEADAARASGLNINSYCDVEMYPDELQEAVALRSVKALCQVLNFDPLELLGIPCAFCDQKKPFTEEYNLPRNELIGRRRNTLGLSTDKLGERVNYNAIEIDRLEEDPVYIENWRLRDLYALAAVLQIPLQVLLHVRCTKCGR